VRDDGLGGPGPAGRGLIHGEVHIDGVKAWNHYWNRLSDGVEVDFTAEKFRAGETVVYGQMVHRPPEGPRRCREEYELLRERALAAQPTT